MPRAPLVALLLLLSACEVAGPPAEQRPQGVKLPESVCKKFREGLETLKKQAGIDVDEKGEATVTELGWFGMNPAQRDQFAQLLAFNAACRSGQPSAEQRVLVRSETGVVLMDRIVETKVDMSELLGDDGS